MTDRRRHCDTRALKPALIDATVSRAAPTRTRTPCFAAAGALFDVEAARR